jgi:perosamine synthetase
MKTDQIEQKITKNTRAIMPVHRHIYGHPTNMGPVMKLTKKQNFVVIENVAEADCAMYR